MCRGRQGLVGSLVRDSRVQVTGVGVLRRLWMGTSAAILVRCQQVRIRHDRYDLMCDRAACPNIAAGLFQDVLIYMSRHVESRDDTYPGMFASK